MNNNFQQLLDDLYLSVTNFVHWHLFSEHLANFFSANVSHILFIDKENPAYGFSIYFDIHQTQQHITGSLQSQSPPLALTGNSSIPRKILNKSSKIKSINSFSPASNITTEGFFAANKLTQTLGTLLPVAINKESLNFLAGFRLYRENNAEPFNQRDIQFYEELIPHFLRAIKLQKQYIQMGDVHKSSIDVMNFLPIGVVLIDVVSKIEYMNQMAQLIINENSIFSIIDNILVCSDKNIMRQLRGLIQHSLHSNRKNILSIPREKTEPVYLSILPIPNNKSSSFQFKKTGILWLNDPLLTTDISHKTLEEIFNFSPSEAKLVSLLVKTSSLKTSRQVLGLTENTARFYLKAIFIKADVSNQAELIKRIITSPAVYTRFENHFAHKY